MGMERLGTSVSQTTTVQIKSANARLGGKGRIAAIGKTSTSIMAVNVHQV
jgi:hypothetical protein